MARRPLILALLLLGSAAPAEPLPDHIVRNIRVTAKQADAMAVVVVKDASGTGRDAKVTFDVEKPLVGALAPVLEVPATGFDRGDLVAGTRLLVALRQRPQDGGWLSTGRYELVADGKIRDVDQAVYLAETVSAMNDALAHRARRPSSAGLQVVPASATAPLGEPRARRVAPVLAPAPQPLHRAPMLAPTGAPAPKTLVKTQPCENFTPANGC